MEEMHFDQLAAPSLPRIMAAAESFGLTCDEVWHAAGDALVASDGDAHAPSYRDDLVACLARRILARHRALLAARRRIP